MDHQRIADEIEESSASLTKDDKDVSELRSAHDEDQEKVNTLKEQQTDLQQVFELVKRLRDEVGRYLQ